MSKTFCLLLRIRTYMVNGCGHCISSLGGQFGHCSEWYSNIVLAKHGQAQHPGYSLVYAISKSSDMGHGRCPQLYWLHYQQARRQTTRASVVAVHSNSLTGIIAIMPLICGMLLSSNHS